MSLELVSILHVLYGDIVAFAMKKQLIISHLNRQTIKQCFIFNFVENKCNARRVGVGR